MLLFSPPNSNQASVHILHTTFLPPAPYAACSQPHLTGPWYISSHIVVQLLHPYFVSPIFPGLREPLRQGHDHIQTPPCLG